MYNGITSAFQAEDTGSTPAGRFALMPKILQVFFIVIFAFVFLGIAMFVSKKIAAFIDKKMGRDVPSDNDVIETTIKGDNNGKETD